MKSYTVAIAAFVAQVEAFWGTAHLLAARRAEELLSQQNPDVLSAALDEMKALKQYYPTLTTAEKNHPFTECATFGDDIKSKGYTFQSSWHYTNLPCLDEPGTTLDDFSFKQPALDVVGALNDMTAFLKNEISADDSPYLT